MLLALFPVNTGMASQDNGNGDTFVGLSLSCDGVRWSAFVQLLWSKGANGRTYDQPVDGLLATGSGVHFFIHRNVEHIAPDADRESRIEQVSFRLDRLAALTSTIKRELGGC